MAITNTGCWCWKRDFVAPATDINETFTNTFSTFIIGKGFLNFNEISITTIGEIIYRDTNNVNSPYEMRSTDNFNEESRLINFGTGVDISEEFKAFLDLQAEIVNQDEILNNLYAEVEGIWKWNDILQLPTSYDPNSFFFQIPLVNFPNLKKETTSFSDVQIGQMYGSPAVALIQTMEIVYYKNWIDAIHLEDFDFTSTYPIFKEYQIWEIPKTYIPKDQFDYLEDNAIRLDAKITISGCWSWNSTIYPPEIILQETMSYQCYDFIEQKMIDKTGIIAGNILTEGDDENIFMLSYYLIPEDNNSLEALFELLTNTYYVGMFDENNNYQGQTYMPNLAAGIIDFGTETKECTIAFQKWLQANAAQTTFEEALKKKTKKLSKKWQWNSSLIKPISSTLDSLSPIFFSGPFCWINNKHINNIIIGREESFRVIGYDENEEQYTLYENEAWASYFDSIWDFGDETRVNLESYNFLLTNATPIDIVGISYNKSTIAALNPGENAEVKCMRQQMKSDLQITLPDFSRSYIVPVAELPTPTNFNENNIYLYKDKYYKGEIYCENIYMIMGSNNYFQLTKYFIDLNETTFTSIYLKTLKKKPTNFTEVGFFYCLEDNNLYYVGDLEKEVSPEPLSPPVYSKENLIDMPQGSMVPLIQIKWNEWYPNLDNEIILVKELPEIGIEGAYYAIKTFEDIAVKNSITQGRLNQDYLISVQEISINDIYSNKNNIEENTIYYVPELVNAYKADLDQNGLITLKLSESSFYNSNPASEIYYYHESLIPENSYCALYSLSPLYRYINGNFKEVIPVGQLTYGDMGDSSCSVTGIGIHYDYSITIPETSPAGKSVEHIAEKAFENKLFNYIDLPVSLLTISDGAFKNTMGYDIGYSTSDKLNSAKLSVIGDEVFMNTTGFNTFGLPTSVTTIGANAFENSSITSIIIPDKVEEIKSQTFLNCSCLSTVTIGAKVETLNTQCFAGCDSLTNITYNGTIEDWETKVLKMSEWNKDVPATQVTCTDGISTIMS